MSKVFTLLWISLIPCGFSQDAKSEPWWSGNSDFSLSLQGGKSDFFRNQDQMAQFERTEGRLGWGYHLLASDFFISGGVHLGEARLTGLSILSSADFPVTRYDTFGYGMGLGYRFGIWEVEGGWKISKWEGHYFGRNDQNEIAKFKHDLYEAGPYLKSAVNLWRNPHGLMQLEASYQHSIYKTSLSDASSLQGRSQTVLVGLTGQFVSIHTAIPAMVVGSAAMVLLCVKFRCGGGGVYLYSNTNVPLYTSYSHGRHDAPASSPQCKDREDKKVEDCSDE